MNAEHPDRPPDCRSCRHYYVTHDAHFPHGCHAMGFKSLQWPSLEVLRSSGQPCLRHQPRPPRTPSR